MPSGSPPEFFVDRSLGRLIVPHAMRAAGVVVHVMADVYGERAGQGLADEEWLAHAGRRGWVVLMKDAKDALSPSRATYQPRVEENGAILVVAEATDPTRYPRVAELSDQ